MLQAEPRMQGSAGRATAAVRGCCGTGCLKVGVLSIVCFQDGAGRHTDHTWCQSKLLHFSKVCCWIRLCRLDVDCRPVHGLHVAWGGGCCTTCRFLWSSRLDCVLMLQQKDLWGTLRGIAGVGYSHTASGNFYVSAVVLLLGHSMQGSRYKHGWGTLPLLSSRPSRLAHGQAVGHASRNRGQRIGHEVH